MAAKSPRLSRRSVNLRSEGGVVFEPPAPLPETETFVFPDGSKYCGEFKVTENQPVVREGTGIMHFSNGSVYEGEWQGDKMHGKGQACVCVRRCVWVLVLLCCFKHSVLCLLYTFCFCA